MPTAPLGPWYAEAVARGLIREPAAKTAPVVALEFVAPPPGATEKDFQRAVVALAEANGWKHFHPHDSRRSASGWPDLALVRSGVLLLAELKTTKGRVSAAQAEWLDALRAVDGVRVRVWRTPDWPAIVAELTAKT